MRLLSLIILLALPYGAYGKIDVKTKIIKRYVVIDGKVSAQQMSKDEHDKQVISSNDSALNPIALLPLKASGKPGGIKPLVLKTLPALSPLTLTAQAGSNKSVSPLGQWLSNQFSWLDNLIPTEPVKPWQKATLAEPAMLPGGVAPVVGKFASKVFISKEASLGGDGVSGGGCGCK